MTGDEYYKKPSVFLIAAVAFAAGGFAFWAGWTPAWLIFLGGFGLLAWHKSAVERASAEQSVLQLMTKDAYQYVGYVLVVLVFVLAPPVWVVSHFDLSTGWVFLLLGVWPFIVLGVLIGGVRLIHGPPDRHESR